MKHEEEPPSKSYLILAEISLRVSGKIGAAHMWEGIPGLRFKNKNLSAVIGINKDQVQALPYSYLCKEAKMNIL